MIIILDDSVASDEYLLRADTQAAVENLYVSMGRGEHYVLASRLTLQKMLTANVNSVNVKAIFEWNLRNYAFLAGLPKIVPPGIVVVAEGATSKLEDGRWQMAVGEIARAGVRPVVLLAENSVDARIFRHAAKHYLISQKLGEVNISVEDRNGNGSGIATELRNLLDRRVEWCLCIPDSDRKCPDGAFGVNAQQCGSVADGATWPMSFRTTSGRELENDVPRTALNDVVSARVAHWREHSDLVERVCGAVLPYADIRRGTRPCDVDEFSAGTRERAYWTEVVRLYAEAIPKEEACSRSGECDRVRGCALLPSSGEGVGAAILDMLDRESAHASYKQHKSSSNFDSWLDLGRVVATQGLSPKRMRL